FVAGARRDAGEAHGLGSGVLVEADTGQGVERGLIVDGADRDREGTRDNVVAGGPVIEGDRNCGETGGRGGRGERQRTGGIGTGVSDSGRWDERWIAGGGGDGQRLGFVAGAGGDA